MSVIADRPRTTVSRPGTEGVRASGVRASGIRASGVRTAGGGRAGARATNARAVAAHLAAADERASATGLARPPLRWAIGTLGLAFVIVAAVVLSRLANDPLRFPVTNVDILGTLDYTGRDALRTRIADEIGKGFHGLDIDTVRREVERLPWVAGARISRVWPGRVSIEIEEHEPAARWNDDALVSKRLALFRPPQLAGDDPRAAEWRELFADLPRLRGADGRQVDVFEDHRRYAAALAPFGVTLTALEEDARRSQTLELANGVEVRLGYEDRERRLARFVDVYDRLVTPLGGRAARFDMRYCNGFALRGGETLPGADSPGGAVMTREPG